MRNRKATLTFILTTIALDSIGIGIIIPVLPDVIRRFLTDEMQISRVYGYFVAIYALLQFLSSPLLGTLSDRFGRRPVLLVSLLGAAIDYFFMAFAPTLTLLFLGRIVSGVSGASFTVASAYIADISDDRNRAKNFGMIGAGFGIGFILGPMIGGLLAQYGSHYPFIAAGCFNLLNFLFGWAFVPESLAQSKRRKIDWKALNPIGSMNRVLKMPAIRGMIVVFFFLQLAGQTHPSIWTLYTQHRFSWSAAEVGWSLAAVGVLNALSQGALTGWLVNRFGNRNVVIYGVLGETICFALFGLASQGWMIYAVLIASAPCWASLPALQSLVSREVTEDRQGELQGTLMGIGSLTAIINPLVMTTLFSMTTNRNQGPYLPGSPYFLAALLIGIAWLMAIRITSPRIESSPR